MKVHFALLLHAVALIHVQAGPSVRMEFEFSGLCLAPLKGSARREGASIHQYSCEEEKDQQWEALENKDATFLIRNKKSKLCLESSGDKIVQRKCNVKADAQVFLYHKNKSGQTRAIQLSQGEGESPSQCLAIKGSSKEEGAELWLQFCSSGVYQVIHTEPLPAGHVVLPRMHFMFTGGMCVAPWYGAPVANGIGVRQYPCSRVDYTQQWEKIPAQEGFLVKNRRSGYCLDGREEEKIRQRPCNPERTYQVFQEASNWGMKLASTGACLGMENNTAASGNLQLQECEEGSPYQRIDTNPAPPPAPPGPPRPQPIRFAFSDKWCLEGSGGEAAIKQVECTGSGSELWVKVRVYGGGFLLNSTKSGNCAAVRGRSKADGAEVVEQVCNGKDGAQVFQDARGGGLRVKHSKKCLAIGGKRLVQWRCSRGRKQRILQEVEEVSLRMPSTGLCLEVLRNKPNVRAPLGETRCTGQLNQRWDKLDVLGGGFRLRNACSGLCMAVQSSNNLARISQAPCNQGVADGAHNDVFSHTNSGALKAWHSGKCVQIVDGETKQTDCDGGSGQEVEVSPRAFVTPRKERYPSPPRRLKGEPPVSDYTLLPPAGTHYMSLSGPATGHTEKRARSSNESPLYYPYDSGEKWVDNLLQEMVQGRVPAIMASSRGTGEGSMNPSDMHRLFEGAERNGLTPDLMKFALFLDTANWSIRARALFGGRGIDFSSHEQFARIVWSENVRPHFDTFPRDRWYRVGNRPVIQTWGLNPAMRARNHFSHLSERYAWLADHFEQVYGERPWFVMSWGNIKNDWGDQTFYDNPDLLGLNSWFNNEGWSAPQFHDKSFGTAIAGFHHTNHRPGIPRENGKLFLNALSATSNTTFTIIESWTNIIEKMAIYKSEAPGWPTPNAYINHLQRYTDPEALTLRLECEAADRFVDTTPGNAGGKGPPRFKEGVYRYSGDLDILELRGQGWAVGWTAPGESITHVGVFFGNGKYRFTLKYACEKSQQVELEVGGVKQGKVVLPATEGWHTWRKIHLATGVKMAEGTADVKLHFVTGSTNADWVFVKKETK